MRWSGLQHFSTSSTQAYRDVEGNNITSCIFTGVYEFVNFLGVFQGCQLQFRYFKHFLSPTSKNTECVVWNTSLSSFLTTALTCWLYYLQFASPIFSSNYFQTKTALSGPFPSSIFESLYAASSGMQLPVSHLAVWPLCSELLQPQTQTGSRSQATQPCLLLPSAEGEPGVRGEAQGPLHCPPLVLETKRLFQPEKWAVSHRDTLRVVQDGDESSLGILPHRSLFGQPS